MPLHDFIAANEEAERELAKDPCQVALSASEPPFTFRHDIQFRHFVQAILFDGPVTDEATMTRPVITVIRDCLVPEDVARFDQLIADSDAGVPGRFVRDAILVQVQQVLVDHYRGGARPLGHAQPSSDSPSNTGPDSTPSSSPKQPPRGTKRTTPKKRASPPPDVDPALVGFVAD